MDLDRMSADSPRSGKRHNSSADGGGSMWSQGSEGGEADTPSSRYGAAAAALQPAWLAGGQQQWAAAGLHQSRFGQEHSRRGWGGDGGDDPAYAPASDRGARGGGGRQQRQASPQQQQAGREGEEEERPQQQFRGVSRHR
jgi:hypothetical protein